MIGGAAQIVTDDAALAGGGDVARVFAQIAFETSAGEQPCVFAVTGDQHVRAGLGIRRAASSHDRGENEGFVGEPRTVVQRQEAVQGHVAEIYASLRALRLRVVGSNH